MNSSAWHHAARRRQGGGSSMQIALTGGTGLVGRHVVRQLAAAGHRLRCWYRPGSDRSGFHDSARAIEWLPGPLRDSSTFGPLMRGAYALVHAAVQWEGPRNLGRGSHGAADVFFGVNLTGSLQLFQEAGVAADQREDLRPPPRAKSWLTSTTMAEDVDLGLGPSRATQEANAAP